MLIAPATNTDEMIEAVERRARQLGVVKSGDVMIITAGSPIGVPGTTNMMKLQVVS